MSTYLEKLDEGLVQRRVSEGPREHLGMSAIGNEDELRLWLDYRWCMPPIEDPRILRIFENGNAVEDMLIRWTQDAGMRLETRDPAGGQFRFSHLGGHFGGSMDGAILGVPEYPGEWLVWEAKSANDARFKGLKSSATDGRPPSWEDLETQGLKAWSPAYYGQVICYMGMSGMKRAMVVVYDKNRSDLHVEFVDADPMAFAQYVSKAERIITAEEPPKSIYSSRTDWRSKAMMSETEQEIYWRERLPWTANCRNCRFSKPDLEASTGQWYCGQHGTLIGGKDAQVAGCPKHQFIPALMPARLVDVSGDGCTYLSNDDDKFTNGEGHFSSAELIELSKDEFALLGDPTFQDLRKQMGAKVQRVERIEAAIAGNAKRAADDKPDNKVWDPWPDEEIPF